MPTCRLRFLQILFLLLTSSIAVAQDFPYDKNIWPENHKMQGHVFVIGEGQVSDTIRDYFYSLSGSDDAVVYAIRFGNGNPAAPNLEKSFSEASKFEEILITQDQTELPESLDEMLSKATGIWISGKDINLTQSKLLLALKARLQERIDSGMPILLAQETAVYSGRQFALRTDQGVEVYEGLNLAPDCLVSTDADSSANLAAVAMEPTLVSVSIPENTSIILSGRKIRTFGPGKVEYRLMANQDKPFRTLSVPEVTGRPNPYRDLIDLTAWRRDAMDRTLPAFPVASPAKPFVENGTLLIVGGGGMPRGLSDEFIELAGGKDAKLIYVPCTESEFVDESRLLGAWRGKVASATVFHTKDRNKADTDEEFLAPLKEATGIWFGGGRQWNFVDSYYGTKAHELMLNVLARGGVVGGSSAGASIQGEYLARANPVANFDIMAPGYERGLGFLQGVAIDQHFSQRGRQKDMTELANTYPQLLGIGLDEATAIIVQKSKAKVVGRGRVFFYDRNQPVIPGEDDFIALEAGSVFDLATRKVIEE